MTSMSAKYTDGTPAMSQWFDIVGSENFRSHNMILYSVGLTKLQSKSLDLIVLHRYRTKNKETIGIFSGKELFVFCVHSVEKIWKIHLGLTLEP